jgi:hypothetical protein
MRWDVTSGADYPRPNALSADGEQLGIGDICTPFIKAHPKGPVRHGPLDHFVAFDPIPD